MKHSLLVLIKVNQKYTTLFNELAVTGKTGIFMAFEY